MRAEQSRKGGGKVIETGWVYAPAAS